jgi:hypothetical protein
MQQSHAARSTRTIRRASVAGLLCCVAVLAAASPATARVLRVGAFSNSGGEYQSIQAAVDAAKSGDWILIGPGDYKEAGTRSPASAPNAAGAAVLVETSGIHIRGMDRNGVTLDGTKPGTPQCSSNPADQNLGPNDAAGHPTGRNGLEVFKATGVSVENLTACNFLTGSRGGGN